jgi:hypothetical protein
MKNFEKSKILKNKEHLWILAQCVAEKLTSGMEAIYGTENVPKYALELIDKDLIPRRLPEEDYRALRNFLYTSFMAKNGASLYRAMPKKERVTKAGRFKAIEDRLAVIEARLGIVPK